jgi:hypothetical protein
MMTALGAVPLTPPGAAFGAAQALTTLLTTESLLFAAFNVGFGLTVPSTTGRRISPMGAYRLALATVFILAVVAWSTTLRVLWALGGYHSERVSTKR